MTSKTRTNKLNSIFIKMSLVIFLVTGIVAGALSMMQWLSANTFAERIVQNRAKNETSAMADEASGGLRFGRGDTVEAMFDALVVHSEGSAISAIGIGMDGAVVADRSSSNDEKQMMVNLAKEAIARGETVVSSDGFIVASPAHFGEDKAVHGAIATRWSADTMLETMHQDLIKAIGIASLVFLLAVSGSLFALKWLLTGPMSKLQSVIQSMGAKDYSVEVPLQGRKDELGAISASLENLREALAMGQATEMESTIKSAAFMGSSAAMMLVDKDMNVTHVNPKVIALFQHLADHLRRQMPEFDPSHMIGIPANRLHSAIQERSMTDNLRGLGKSGFSTVLTFGEARISLNIAGIRDAANNDAGYVLEWADITETSLNAALIDAINASQVKVEFGLDGLVLSANQSFAGMINIPEDRLRNTPITQLIHQGQIDGRDVKSIMNKVTQGDSHSGQFQFKRLNDEMAIVDGSLSCVNDHQGKPVRLLLLGKDVTRAEMELRAARQERAEAARQQTVVVEALRLGLRQLNSGDLTARINEPFAGDYEDLRKDFNDTVRSLSNAMLEILTNAKNISNEARDITSTADNLSRRTETTAATLEQTAAALDMLTNSVRSTADGAEKADQAVSDAKANAESSSKVVVETVSAMDQIASSSERITSIIKVIDDIAFQTNLLALNAGVEAARAGDAGRGFAVVASEVRALAQRSSEAAREINDLIANSATQVRRGVTLVDKTGAALKQIADSVSEIADLVSDIAIASRQQSANLVEINGAVNQLDQSTQQNAARLEETTAASEGLTKDSEALVETVSLFKVSSDDGAGDHVVNLRTNKPKSQQRHSSPAQTNTHPTGATTANLALARQPDVNGWEDF